MKNLFDLNHSLSANFYLLKIIQANPLIFVTIFSIIIIIN